MKKGFGDYTRERRELLKTKDASFSLRQVANRIGVEPSYLSKVERGEQPPPSEEKIRALARELNENADVLLNDRHLKKPNGLNLLRIVIAVVVVL